MLKADFHIHTFYSSCSNMKPEDIIKTALSKNYDVIGIVDHNTVKGGILTKKIAGKKILVIPGEEIKTNEGEVLVLFSDGKYNNNLIDICERCKEMGHFLIIPHPFDLFRFRTSIMQKINKIKNIDAIETFNSRIMMDKFNLIAKNFSLKNRIPQIAGSDAHFYEEIGNAAVFLDCERNVDSIVDCIKKNKIKFKCKKTSLYPHIKSMLLKLNRRFS